MTSIENIYNDFRATYQDNPDFTLDFYNNNSVLLNNIKIFTDSEQLRLYIELIGRYLSAHYKKSHYNEIINIVDEKRQIIDCEISRLDYAPLKDDWYYNLIYHKGMASYNLKDYKTATSIFEELVKIDSKNDNYKYWLRYCKSGQVTRFSRVITIICGVTLVADIFFGKLISSNLLKLWVMGTVFLLLVIIQSYEYYLRYSLRKTKEK